MKKCEAVAVAIYGMMGQNLDEAIDMIQGCKNLKALRLLQSLLTTKGPPGTDYVLNGTFAPIVQKRLSKLER